MTKGLDASDDGDPSVAETTPRTLPDGAGVKSSLIGSEVARAAEVTHPGVAGHLQLRQLAERTVDAHLVGAEVDRDGLALHLDHAAKAVLVMGDTVLNGILLDLLNGLEVVEGTAGKESPARRGSRAHSFSMPSSGEANLGTRQGSILDRVQLSLG